MAAQHETFNWTEDDIRYFGQMWSPENPKAVIALVHGMGEHSGRWERSAQRFNDAGYAVISYDLIGHGQTEGKRGHSPNLDVLYRSVMKLIEEAENRFPNQPVFLYGHSMGGNIAANTLMRLKPGVKGAVLSSPWLQLPSPPPAWQVLLGRIMMSIYPSFSDKTGLDSNAISRIPEEVAIYEQDPLVHDRITPALFFPMADAGAFVLAQAKALEVPVYLMHGTGDTLTSHKASKQFAREGGKNVTLRLWDKGYHELHHDKDREAVLDELIQWLDSQLQG